ncbi:MAG: DUF4258 domain-containing protein [Candidatus Paceibacterota bacterium]
MNRTYKNLVFTKHALTRLADRSITQDAIYQVIATPDQSSKQQANTKFIRTINNRLIHVVASPIKNHRWLIISVWVRGEEDRVPFMWRLLTLPLRLVWKMLQSFWRYSKN